MPVQGCTRAGKAGWKWGSAGFCYTGPHAAEQARKQGIAVLAAKARARGATTKAEVGEAIASHASSELRKKF